MTSMNASAITSTGMEASDNFRKAFLGHIGSSSRADQIDAASAGQSQMRLSQWPSGLLAVAMATCHVCPCGHSWCTTRRSCGSVPREERCSATSSVWQIVQVDIIVRPPLNVKVNAIQRVSDVENRDNTIKAGWGLIQTDHRPAQ